MNVPPPTNPRSLRLQVHLALVQDSKQMQSENHSLGINGNYLKVGNSPHLREILISTYHPLNSIQYGFSHLAPLFYRKGEGRPEIDLI